jgi:GcrA cell cycle regulator
MPKDTRDRICWRTGCYGRASTQANSGWYCDEHVPFEWTAERVAELKRLDAQGLSAAQVAKKMGQLTRSAVIGKLHRLGVTKARSARARMEGHNLNNPRRTPRSADPGIAKVPVAAIGPKLAAKPFTPKPALVPADAKPALLTDLRHDQCRWPLDDPGRGNGDRMLFCAAPAGGIYCDCHAAVARGKPHPKAPVTANELARSLRRYTA